MTEKTIFEGFLKKTKFLDSSSLCRIVLAILNPSIRFHLPLRLLQKKSTRSYWYLITKRVSDMIQDYFYHWPLNNNGFISSSGKSSSSNSHRLSSVAAAAVLAIFIEQ